MKNKIRNSQKKGLVILCFILMMAILSGCGNDNEKNYVDIDIPEQTVIEEQTDNLTTDNEEAENQEADNFVTSNEKTENSENDNLTSNNEEVKNQEDENKDVENQPIDNYEPIDIVGNNIIGGKVRSIENNSFIISRTLIDENGYVTMPEEGSSQEELVNIICTDETVFEHWTIQGGGAGIERKEAGFSDIIKGGGLEAEGHFEGEEFIADKVIIEVYK